MGMHSHIHLGPYVRCTFRKEMRDVSFETCPNAVCPRHGKTPREEKFCAQCGTQIGKITIRQPHRPSVYETLGNDDVLLDLNGNEESKKYLYLAANTTKGPRDFLQPNDEILHIDLTNTDRAAEMKWFEDRYAETIRLLREAYDDVTICWGLHQFWW